MLCPTPELEDGVDYIHLEWKKELLELKIIPITYGTYRNISNRTLLVAGLRNIPRPYSLRVEARGKLDGKFRCLCF